jgi:hypothetical protein
MKSIARHQQTVAASSSSSEKDIFLCADHDDASAPTCDAASFSTISQRRGSVPSQRGQFTRKYQA